mmetsp:Transcript_23359/g.56378  ORF Transcript_23359/g.56378 Transcript_23359/m.56378 type:complete len:699 (-) Transcript_23359:357-2453(-)
MNSTDSYCIPATSHNKQVSDSASSLSRPSTPSPAPMWSSSSTSSSSHDNSSIICTKSTKARKSGRNWICPICEGDVRNPPPCAVTETNERPTAGDDRESISLKTSESRIRKDDECAFEPIHVKCAFKSCPSPRYHLTCSGVPKGSQVFWNAVMSCHTAANETVASTNNSNKTMVERPHSSTGGGWWDPSLMGGKQRSQQSLQNNKDWPTSMLSFMCRNCDVEGRSRYLSEYFERFNSMKKSFYAKYLSGTNIERMGCRQDRADESVEARTGEAFLWYLLEDNNKYFLRKEQAQGGSICYDGEVENWKPSEIHLQSMANILTFLSKQQQMQQHRRRQKRQKNKFQLDPSYLVGMPIRLFNPIDNSYHSGHVLDYKTNAPYQVDQSSSSSKPSASSDNSSSPDVGQLIDGKICSTLFLIRFRQGVEGRKVAVHEWVYLEEHAVTIGGEICWAKVGHHSGEDAKAYGSNGTNEESNANGKGKSDVSGTRVLKSDVKLQVQKGEFKSQYRPVQIIFRSMLEMIPAQSLNPMPRVDRSGEGNPCLKVLAMGFGESFCHVRLSLGGSAMLNANETQLKVAKETATAASTAAADQMKPEVFPLTSSHPTWFDRILRRAQLSDEDVALGLAMACCEKEEERRIRSWRQLSISHLYQPSLSKRNDEATSINKPSTSSTTESNKRQKQCITPFMKSPSNTADTTQNIS